MRVAYFTGLREIETRDEPPPVLEKPDAVLLRIDRVGVCGSDVHYYTAGGIGDQRLTYPATLGHECCGTIVEVGPAVDRLRPGTRVAVDPALVCGECDQCRAGRVNTCRRLRFMGCPGEAPGAVAELREVPAANCLPIPQRMSLELATLVEPLSVGLHAVRLGRVRPNARMAVLGAGPIGLSVLLCATAAAPCTVYVTDLLDERLEVARQCGAHWTGNPQREDVVGEILRQQPDGLDVVFECSGDPACVDQGQQLLTPGGTLVMVGIPAVVQLSFDVHLMRRRELSFVAVRRQRGCMAPAIRMIDRGQVDLRPLLTHRFPLERIRDAFELVARYGQRVLKAVIELSEAE